MKSITFDEVIKLINNSRVTKINEKPIESDPNKWALFQGVNKVPLFEYEFYVLYLYSDATKDSMAAAFYAIKDRNPESLQVVYPQSLSKWKNDIKKLFIKQVKGIQTSKDYLTSFIKDQLSAYQQKLSEIKPEYFINPPYETPSGFKVRFPNPLVMMMAASDDVRHNGDIGVLIAEPGQGKTFTARHIVSELCTRNTLPIYIDSQQWTSLSPDDLSSIWKTISHSFRYFDSSIDWIDGCEEIFLNVTMKAGIFRLVFDGFDEYILWNRGKVDVNEALKGLTKLVEETGAPILVTSRTSFWDSDVSKELISKLIVSPSVYKIIPFDQNHAKSYFNVRFNHNEEKTTEALKIYQQLRKFGNSNDASNFAGRGFILYLIADLADHSFSPSSLPVEGQTIIQWVMKSLCEREQKRQKLPINADTQLKIFREIAEAIACGDKVTSSVLRDIITLCADDIDPSGVDDLVGDSKGKKGKFHDHPLVRKDSKEEWVFVHEQLFFNLFAEQILCYTERSGSTLHKLFNRLSTGELITLIHELATCIVAQLSSISKENVAIKKIGDVIEALMTCYDQQRDSYETVKLEKILASSIALLAVNQYAPAGRPRRERFEKLQSIIPAGQFDGFHFSGSITSMDFSDVVFKDCRFDHVIWVNCKFNEGTIFNGCHFMDGNIQHCEGFGKAQWKNEVLDNDARALINVERIATGKKKYSDENLRTDIDSIIKKFVPKEGLGFKTVHEDNLTSGIISKSIYRDDIIKMFVRKLFDKHHVSGATGVAYHIKDDAKPAISHYAINGVYTGDLNDAYQELLRILKLNK